MPEPPPELAEPAALTTDLQAALAGMVDRPFLASRQQSQLAFRAQRDGCHPIIEQFEAAFLRRMKRLGIPMFASEIWRSNERQQMLYDQGRSKAKPGEGPHPYGCAIDLVHSLKGWNLNRDEWLLIGHVGKELAVQRGWRLVWGGDWKFYDPAHWEVEDWRVIRGVFQSHPHVTNVHEALAIRREELEKALN